MHQASSRTVLVEYNSASADKSSSWKPNTSMSGSLGSSGTSGDASETIVSSDTASTAAADAAAEAAVAWGLDDAAYGAAMKRGVRWDEMGIRLFSLFF